MSIKELQASLIDEMLNEYVSEHNSNCYKQQTRNLLVTIIDGKIMYLIQDVYNQFYNTTGSTYPSCEPYKRLLNDVEDLIREGFSTRVIQRFLDYGKKVIANTTEKIKQELKNQRTKALKDNENLIERL